MDEQGGETTPLENHQPDQESDDVKNTTDQLKSLVSKPTDSSPSDQNVSKPDDKQSKPSPNEATTGKQDDKQVSKVSPATAVADTSTSKEPVRSQEQDSSHLSGITSFGAALQNVLKLIEGIIPERYRSKLSHLVALVVVLVVLAGVAWTFRHVLLGIPDIYITVINKSDQSVPQHIRATIIDHTGKEIDGHPMQLIRNNQEQDKDEKIQLRFPKRQKLYRAYEAGNVYLALQFYLDQGHEKLKYISARFLFSKEGLQRPPPIVLGSELYSDQLGIYVSFEIDPDAEPDRKENLKSVMEELEKAARQMFWVATRSDYELAKEKSGIGAKKNESAIKNDNLASKDSSRLIMVQITIIGYIQIGSNMMWAFDLNETQKRIRDFRVSVDCGPILTDMAKKMILEELQKTIVDHCGIKGTIYEVMPSSTKKGKYVAILDINSLHGVRKGLVFNVLSKGTLNLPCGTVEITKVTQQSTWGAEGILDIDVGELNESNYIDYEDSNVVLSPTK